MQLATGVKAVLGAAGLLLFGNLLAQSGIRFTEAILARIKDQHGPEAVLRVNAWQHLLSQNGDTSDQQKLLEVNRFFNQRQFVADLQHWQQEDYWATPLEFLATDAGDCEDFSIAKYFSLQALGVSTDKMRLMYVKAVKLNQAHMVLAYYPSPNEVPLILDNLNPDILPASQRPDLLPIYSFNGEGLWLAKAQGRGQRLQDKGNNSLWENLTERIEQGY